MRAHRLTHPAAIGSATIAVTVATVLRLAIRFLLAAAGGR